jgi:hypothetical protein
MANATSDMPRHIGLSYKDAVENIIFNKKQQWVTTNYALIIYAAIFTVSANFFSRNDMVRALLGILTALTFVYHVYMLKLLQDAITAFRNRLAQALRAPTVRHDRAGGCLHRRRGAHRVLSVLGPQLRASPARDPDRVAV